MYGDLPDLPTLVPLQAIADHFDALPDDDDRTPRCNIAPTQPVPIIRQHPKEPHRDLSLVRWGLIPSWAKDASSSGGMINARSESAVVKPLFRWGRTIRRAKFSPR